jgi:hypothetical protein
MASCNFQSLECTIFHDKPIFTSDDDKLLDDDDATKVPLPFSTLVFTFIGTSAPPILGHELLHRKQRRVSGGIGSKGRIT